MKTSNGVRVQGSEIGGMCRQQEHGSPSVMLGHGQCIAGDVHVKWNLSLMLCGA
jgi:hypothetical protein